MATFLRLLCECLT